MIFDCKNYVKNTLEETKSIVKLCNLKPILGIITFSTFDKGTQSYLKGIIKDCEEVGIECRIRNTEASLLYTTIYNLKKENVDGIILMAPYPKGISYSYISTILTKTLDIDNFLNRNDCSECTIEAVSTIMVNICKYIDYSVSGKKVLIINRSERIGLPLSRLFLKLDAAVTICHSKVSKDDIIKYAKNSDIIISATSIPHFLTEDNIKEDSILFDLGTGVENGHIVGDFDTEGCKDKALMITPNPSGIGLVTRSCLIGKVLSNNIVFNKTIKALSEHPMD